MRSIHSIDDSLDVIENDNEEFDHSEVMQLQFLTSLINEIKRNLVDLTTYNFTHSIKALRHAFIETTQFHQRDVVLAFEIINFDKEIVIDKITKNDSDMIKSCHALKLDGGVDHKLFISEVIYPWSEGKSVLIAKLSIA